MSSVAEFRRLADTPDLWARHRSIINELYQDRNENGKMLEKVRSILIQTYGFPDLPKSIYEARIRDIVGSRRRMKKKDWATVWLHCRELQKEGRNPEVYLNGSHIPWKQAWKEIRRNKAHTHAAQGLPIQPLPSGVVVQSATSPPPRSLTPCVGLPRPSEGPTVRQRNIAITPSHHRALVTSLPGTLLSGSQNGTRPVHCTGRQLSLGDTLDIDLSRVDIAREWKRMSLANLPFLQVVAFAQAVSASESQQAQIQIGDLMQLSGMLYASQELANLPPEAFRSHDEHSQSPGALSWEIDPLQFIVKAIFRLSNGTFHPWFSWSHEHDIMVTMLFTRIPISILSIIFLSQLPSARLAWRNLQELLRAISDPEALWKISSGPPIYRFGLSHLLFRPASMKPSVMRVILPRTKLTIETFESAISAMTLAIRVGNLTCLKLLMQWSLEGLKRVEWLPQIDKIMRREFNDDASRDVALERLAKTMVEEGLPPAVAYKILRWTPVDRHAISITGYFLCAEIGRAADEVIGSYRKASTLDDRYLANDEVKELTAQLRSHLRRRNWTWDIKEYMSGISTKIETQTAAVREINSLPHAVLGFSIYVGSQERAEESVLSECPAHSPEEHHTLATLFSLMCCSNLRSHARRNVEALLHHGMTTCSTAVSRLVYGYPNESDCIGDLRLLKDLGADIRVVGRDALVAAATREFYSAMHWLLSEGVDANGTVLPILQGDDEVAIIFNAASGGASVDTIRLFIAHGAKLVQHPNDIDAVDFLQIFTQEHGAEQEQVRRLDALTRSTNLLELSNQRAEKLLLHCMDGGPSYRWSVLDYLLDRGVHATAATLYEAISKLAPRAVIQRLLATENMDLDDHARSHCYAPIMAAAQVWDLESMKQLVAKGARLHLRTPEGYTVLHKACEARAHSFIDEAARMDVIKYLVEHGAEIDARDGFGATALAIASAGGQIELAIYFLDHGADWNALYNSPERHKIKLRNAGTIEANHFTVLDLAAFHGSLDLVQLLLNIGATSHYQGVTPYEGAIGYASHRDHYEVVEILEKHADHMRAGCL